MNCIAVRPIDKLIYSVISGGDTLPPHPDFIEVPVHDISILGKRFLGFAADGSVMFEDMPEGYDIMNPIPYPPEEEPEEPEVPEQPAS